MMTSAQIRDHRLSRPEVPLTIDIIQDIRADYRKMKEARAASDEFVECPRCREHHEGRRNYEKICARCRLILLDDYPNHPFTLEMERAEGFVRNAVLST